MSGLGNIFIEQTLTDAVFATGPVATDYTTLSGHYTVEFSAAGAVIGVSSVDLTASSIAGTTTFSGLGQLYSNTSNGLTYYEIHDFGGGPLTGPYTSLYLDFQGETPTRLAVNNHGGLYTSISEGTGQNFTSYGLETGGGGTIVSQVVCFLAGTAIAVRGGLVAIEQLRAGDLVMTNDGQPARIRWLGRQTVSTRFADPLRVLPIRIKVGALGAGLPVRDLLVSPCHALLVDGVLIQAGALVNGETITREANVPEIFTYYHVELADQSLIFAEGVPAETFIDNIDRLGFDNWAEHEALDVSDQPMVELDYPRAKAARQVPIATRNRLLALAALNTGRAFAA